MQTSSYHKYALLFVGLAAFAAAPVQATILVNNDVAVVENAPFNGGSVIAPFISGTFDTGGAFGVQGTYLNAVVLNGAGFLDFYYQFTVNTAGANVPSEGIDSVSTSDFTGYIVDVAYDSTSSTQFGLGMGVTGNQAPSLADRSAQGGTIGFNFKTFLTDNEVNAGETRTGSAQKRTRPNSV